jgi:hypothetical protein
MSQAIGSFELSERDKAAKRAENNTSGCLIKHIASRDADPIIENSERNCPER